MSRTTKPPALHHLGIGRAYLENALLVAGQAGDTPEARAFARDTLALVERAAERSSLQSEAMRGRPYAGQKRGPSYNYTVTIDWPDEPERGASVTKGATIEELAEVLDLPVTSVRAMLAKAQGELVRTRVLPIERKRRAAYGPSRERVRYHIQRHKIGTEHASPDKANKPGTKGENAP